MDTLRTRLARDVDGAFEELVVAMRDGLYSGVRRLVPQSADAEDICAEAFLRAYRALSVMPPDQVQSLDVAPWMWTIALNLTRNAARRRARKPWVTLDTSWGGESAEQSPESSAVDHSYVAELVEALPRQQRTAVVLRHVAGLTYAEIAAATGRPEGSVRSDVSRGLERLRRSEER